MDGFHVGDGLYFNRLEDGSVEVIKLNDATDPGNVKFRQVIDSDTWPSVVGAVAKTNDSEKMIEIERIHQT